MLILVVLNALLDLLAAVIRSEMPEVITMANDYTLRVLAHMFTQDLTESCLFDTSSTSEET